MTAPIRVLVVDDSAFMRYTIAKHLENDGGISVVGSARDGVDALTKVPVLSPDVITMDVEMPRMDGLTALQRIMTECPTPVVMLSSLTQSGTRTTIQAIMRGAVDFVPKPTASTDMPLVIEELISKIKTAAGARRALQRLPARLLSSAETVPLQNQTKVELRHFRSGDPIIIIGASTGGPRALQQVLSGLPADLPAAVVIIQHMPPGFTRSLAQRLNENSPLTIQEAQDGDRLAQGLALLAPGDFHLQFKGDNQVALDHGPRRQHVRPAVDVTMEAASERYRSSVIGVVLTGMGSDGTAGSGYIKAAGGQVIVEHESTSLVYGMPRSVVEAGWADRVVPLPEVASTLIEVIYHGKPRV